LFCAGAPVTILCKC